VSVSRQKRASRGKKAARVYVGYLGRIAKLMMSQWRQWSGFMARAAECTDACIYDGVRQLSRPTLPSLFPLFPCFPVTDEWTPVQRRGDHTHAALLQCRLRCSISLAVYGNNKWIKRTSVKSYDNTIQSSSDIQVTLSTVIHVYAPMDLCKINFMLLKLGCQYFTVYHSGNVSSSSVNGDIAFLWEWSNFDHS